MIFSSFMLIVLAASGSAILWPPKDVGPLLDDLIDFIVPIMEANGDTEITFMPIKASASVPGKKVKEFFKSNKLVQVPKYLNNLNAPVNVSFDCKGGRLGDITTIQRTGPAGEALFNLFSSDLFIGAALTLQNMYVEYPNSCKVKINEVNHMVAKVIFTIPSNRFVTMIDVHGEGKNCRVSVNSAFKKFGMITTKAYIADTEDRFLEGLFDQLIRENAEIVGKWADEGLDDALNNALDNKDACRFLKPANKKGDQPKNN